MGSEEKEPNRPMSNHSEGDLTAHTLPCRMFWKTLRLGLWIPGKKPSRAPESPQTPSAEEEAWAPEGPDRGIAMGSEHPGPRWGRLWLPAGA